MKGKFWGPLLNMFVRVRNASDSMCFSLLLSHILRKTEASSDNRGAGQGHNMGHMH